jgi:hypothetical protein
MKKLIIPYIVINLFCGCKDAYPKEEKSNMASWEYLQQLRTKAFNSASDSFNKYTQKCNEALIINDRELAVFYKGKAEAYFDCIDIIWPK